MCDDFFEDTFEDNLFDPDNDFQEDLAGEYDGGEWYGDAEDTFTANFDEESAVAGEEANMEATFNQVDALIIGTMIAGQAIEDAKDGKSRNRLINEKKKKK